MLSIKGCHRDDGRVAGGLEIAKHTVVARIWPTVIGMTSEDVIAVLGPFHKRVLNILGCQTAEVASDATSHLIWRYAVFRQRRLRTVSSFVCHTGLIWKPSISARWATESITCEIGWIAGMPSA